MGLFSSKTRYYVSSSSSPLFRQETRINLYAAAMLDYTANSVIDHADYVKDYYNKSRLRNYQGYLKWCRNRGFNRTFGEVTSNFYGNASVDNNRVTEIMKGRVSVPKKGELKVYSTNLNVYSEDFWVRCLATQQGKAHWFFRDKGGDYTISYPSNGQIKVTFSDGKSFTGNALNPPRSARFAEISYSILYLTKSTSSSPTLDDEGNPTGDSTTVTTTETHQDYGFYLYQEGTGISELDTVIRNNNISYSRSFYPPIPIRTDTRWFDGGQAAQIESALEYLQIIGTGKKAKNSYEQLKNAITNNMKEGSINDIDYITLMLGVSLTSTNQADLRYIYEFFLNLHVNAAIKSGIAPSVAENPKRFGIKSQYFAGFAGKQRNILMGWYKKKQNLLNPTSFEINCSASNLRLSFDWFTSDYWEKNGTFRPGAKAGDYGILSGIHTVSWKEEKMKTDHEGNPIGHWEEAGWGYDFTPEYETVTRKAEYTLTAFCYQVSSTRFHMVVLSDLSKVNHIYHGKTIETFAYDSIKGADVVRSTVMDFSTDSPDEESPRVTLFYVHAEGEPDGDFVIPLEENTYREVGIRNQLEISYGSQFLIFNCWVKKKKRWYQRGIFGAVLAVVSVVITVFCPPAGASMMAMVLQTFAAIVLGMYAVMAVSTVALKILTTIFGDKFGKLLFSVVKAVMMVVITVVAFYTNQLYLIPLASSMMSGGETLRQGGSPLEALKSAAVSGGASAIGTYAGGALFSAGPGASLTSQMGFAATSTFVSSMATGLLEGKGFAQTFRTSVLSAAVSGAAAALSAKANDFLKNVKLNASPEVQKAMVNGNEVITYESVFKPKPFGEMLGDELMNQVVKNPNTYADLLKESQEMRMYHKMANLENDYQEFNDRAQSAYRVLDQLKAAQTSTATAEFVAKTQSLLSRYQTLFPEAFQNFSPEQFLSGSIQTGADILRASAGTVYLFCENKLQMPGYSPAMLTYSYEDPALVT